MERDYTSYMLAGVVLSIFVLTISYHDSRRTGSQKNFDRQMRKYGTEIWLGNMVWEYTMEI